MTVELIDIVKKYGKNIVINGITEKIETGEFFVILGPSGEGKSTLLKILAGIEKLDKGKIIADGVDITDKPPEKRNVAMVFQNYALYPNMSVRDNIAFPLKMRGMKKEEIMERVEKAAKLAYQNLPSNISSLYKAEEEALQNAFFREPVPWITVWGQIADNVFNQIIVNHAPYSQIPQILSQANKEMYQYLLQNYNATVAQEYEEGVFGPLYG